MLESGVIVPTKYLRKEKVSEYHHPNETLLVYGVRNTSIHNAPYGACVIIVNYLASANHLYVQPT